MGPELALPLVFLVAYLFVGSAVTISAAFDAARASRWSFESSKRERMKEIRYSILLAWTWPWRFVRFVALEIRQGVSALIRYR